MPDRFIPESELRFAIKEILAEMLGLQAELQSSQQWHDTDPAYKLLNLGSAKTLRELVKCGVLRLGTEVRDTRKICGQKARYQFHIEKCLARLCELPEKRATTPRGRSRKIA